MNTHADKTQENTMSAGRRESQSVANGVTQKQSSAESIFQFVDNRPEAIAQRKLQEVANNSPRTMQLKAFQDMANNSPQAKQAAQLQAIANNHAAQPQQSIQKKENNTGLPDNLKTGIENLSGYSMDDVKVHYNSDKPAQLNAHAYAQGTDIHIASGQEKHLPHEAWHVVQQKQGRVKPTMQMRGKVNINDDAGLENEADVMGAKAFQFMDNRSEAIAQRKLHEMMNTHSTHVNQIVRPVVQQKHSPIRSITQFQSDNPIVIQYNGEALAELKEHLLKIPTYMHEAIYRWAALIGASAVLAYLTGGGSLLSQAAVFLLPTTGWLASGALKLIYDRIPYSGDGLKIGTGPLIEDTFHLSTYSFPWSAGSYDIINSSSTVGNGNYIFILDTKDTFFYVTSADREKEGAHLYVRHSQLAGGGKVKTAGRMIIKDNKCVLTNESGHYWPSVDSLGQAKEVLEKAFIFDSVGINAFEPQKDK